MKAFHAYDIRGIYNQDFNSYDVFRAGYFLPDVIPSTRVLIGRDARASSPEIAESLKAGLVRRGMQVFDAGLSTTPMIYWLTAKYGFDASVMITASHNPKEYNGLKISRRDALPVGYDTGLNELEKRVTGSLPCNQKHGGSIHDFDQRQDYIHFLKAYKGDDNHLVIAADTSNGMAGLLIDEIFGAGIHCINKVVDGTFPVHGPNPLDPKNYKGLKAVIADHPCDLGMMFDGDADRVVFTDEEGNFISPDLIIAVLGHYFLEEKGLKGNVLQDIRSSRAIGTYLEPMGAKMHTWKVGRAFAALKLREIDGIYGGELAGHYYFRDFYYSDSAFLAAILVTRVLSAMKRKGLKFPELIRTISPYFSTGEINFTVENKAEAIKDVINTLTSAGSPDKVMDFDGYRLEFKNWWFNIRPSNTEPYLRLILEADRKDILDDKLAEITRIITKYGTP